MWSGGTLVTRGGGCDIALFQPASSLKSEKKLYGGPFLRTPVRWASKGGSKNCAHNSWICVTPLPHPHYLNDYFEGLRKNSPFHFQLGFEVHFVLKTRLALLLGSFSSEYGECIYWPSQKMKIMCHVLLTLTSLRGGGLGIFPSPRVFV